MIKNSKITPESIVQKYFKSNNRFYFIKKIIKPIVLTNSESTAHYCYDFFDSKPASYINPLHLSFSENAIGLVSFEQMSKLEIDFKEYEDELFKFKLNVSKLWEIKREVLIEKNI